MDFKVNLAQLSDIAELEAEWRSLEPRSSSSFFLSWTWIGAWLKASGTRPLVAKVTLSGEVVGLALITARTGGFIFGRTSLYLHESGDREIDRLFVEYNGFLLDERYEAQVTREIVLSLANLTPRPQLTANGVSESFLTHLTAAFADVEVVREEASPYADLTHLAAAGPSFLDNLSANARAQIRRSLRLYAEDGEIELKRARSVEEALLTLRELEILHQARWQSRGKPGGFDNRAFSPFLEAMINEGLPRGEIDLLTVLAGQKPIGYLCNFVHKDRVYNYTSGFAYSADPHLKPGLVSHVCAINDYVDRGVRSYGFLAGANRYKETLSSGAERLFWVRMNLASLRNRR